MRSLFDMDQEGNLTISPEAYSLLPFKKIWDRDKTKGKFKALIDVSYIYWFCDYRSYVSDITDTVQRNEEVISLITDDVNYQPDQLVLDAVEFYMKDMPLSLHFLNDVKCAINELRRYFRDLDLTETDDKGKPVHNANQVMNSIKSTGDLLDTLEKHETKVKKDLDMNNAVRGEKTKAMYED